MEIDVKNFAIEFKHNAMMQIPDSIHCKMKIASCLKHTEFSEIYLLYGESDSVTYIMRVAPIDSLELLMREHHLLSRLHDESFPHPIACFVDKNKAYLIREYVEGISLGDIIEDSVPLKAEIAVDYVKQVCRIIAKLHALEPPVIHRDIKPQNFILSPDGKLRLVDLDTVTEKHSACSVSTLSIGTPATAAPEQFGYWQCDERTDIYGIGMLLVFLLTGGHDASVYVKRRISGPLSRIIRKSLQFDPRRRYKSVARFARALTLWQIRWTWRALAFALIGLVIVLVAKVFVSRFN